LGAGQGPSAAAPDLFERATSTAVAENAWEIGVPAGPARRFGGFNSDPAALRDLGSRENPGDEQ
jgi:hypothetical protein